MSNTLFDQSDETAPEMPDELASLKARAKVMGIQHSNNISVETLRQKIAEKLGEVEEGAKETASTKAKNLRQHLIERQMKLVRLRIVNMDPKKKNLPGEIFTVANEYLGTVKKYVPYGEAAQSYHVPFCIYNQLRARQFLDIRITKKAGREHIEQRWVREFALEVLPQLTPAEIAKLATKQAAMAGIIED